MKMESPLEVLSRAASIVQKEESPKLSTERRSSGASGSEEDTVKQRDTPPASPNASTCRDRRSPKRQHSVSEKSFKKLKLDDNKEEQYKRISPKPYHIHPSCAPVTTTTYTYSSKVLIPVTMERNVRRNSGSPPPLIAISETRKNRSKLPDYDTLFPRPSVISSSPPSSKYIDYCSRKGSGCNECPLPSCCTKNSSSRFSHSTIFGKKASIISSVITRDFDLPTVDDHFRKSLGDKYDLSKHSNFNERPSSVDDHFAKALGTKWYSLEYGRCASS